jgi:D-alanyl-D-alanine carboxypeptidase
MATLALHLMDDFPGYYQLFSTRTFTYRGKSYRNHNTMLNTFAGVDGIKTGYTRASGFNLVTSVHRGGNHLVGVVFGGKTAASRNAEMRVLLTKAFTRASTAKTRKPMLIAKARSTPKAAPRPVADTEPRDAAASERPTRAARAAKSSPSRAAEVASSETPIQIFKVRHVPLVAKAASPEETTDMQATSEPDESSPVQTASADRGSDADFLSAAERLGRRAEMLGAADRVPAAERTAPAAEPVAFAPASGPFAAAAAAHRQAAIDNQQTTASLQPPRQRGQPPSTLNAQASALSGRSGPPPAQHGQRQATTLRATAGRYEVQIGAFGSIADAQRALNSVQDRAKQLLAGVPSVTHPGTVNGRQIFRARFAGFNADRAASTCTELRRKGVDCFVMAGQ